jgi:hypothetical protein
MILEKVLYQYHFDFLGLLNCFVPLILGLWFFFFWKIYLKMKPGSETKGNPGYKGYKWARVFGRFGGSSSFHSVLSVIKIV